MNEGNICAGLEVVDMEDSSIGSLYRLQLKLQTRLEQGHEFNPSQKLIYWRHCVHSEGDELVEWLGDEQEDLKEARMELVDMLHFVFNMGVSIGLTPKEVQFGYDSTSYHIDLCQSRLEDSVKVNLVNFSAQLTTLIDLFPWKTWKNYESFRSDKTSIVVAYGSVLNSVYMLGSLLGMDESMVANFFHAKNKENHARQDRGY